MSKEMSEQIDKINKINNFVEFLNENNLFKNKNIHSIFDGSVVSDYFIELNHRENVDMDLYNSIKNNAYTLEKIKIKDLLNVDIDLKEFVQNEINDVDELNHSNNSVFEPIIIGKSPYVNNLVVVDGYHRITELLRRNISFVEAYVPIM